MNVESSIITMEPNEAKAKLKAYRTNIHRIYPTECKTSGGETVPCIRVRGVERVVFTESDEEAA